MVLSGMSGAWEVGPRSAAELEEAAAHFDRAAAISRAPAGKAAFAGAADACRRVAAAAMDCDDGVVQPVLPPVTATASFRQGSRVAPSSSRGQTTTLLRSTQHSHLRGDVARDPRARLAASLFCYLPSKTVTPRKVSRPFSEPPVPNSEPVGNFRLLAPAFAMLVGPNAVARDHRRSTLLARDRGGQPADNTERSRAVFPRQYFPEADQAVRAPSLQLYLISV
eukprot:scaffold80140_cov61-Phaeocystis_antarctica.AAC.1